MRYSARLETGCELGKGTSEVVHGQGAVLPGSIIREFNGEEMDVYRRLIPDQAKS